ncbi:unnamed protein product (mitochondrion) [Plasmodiophora brassicae]|uniref:Uncharacterized protein n=1 Tax=Plasmodiophora brassicae TaxID=37360 RepID=A0A3P3YEX4_PLABS|nr:unnamed protein product [Plasmodiophora brassicae]
MSGIYTETNEAPAKSVSHSDFVELDANAAGRALASLTFVHSNDIGSKYRAKVEVCPLGEIGSKMRTSHISMRMPTTVPPKGHFETTSGSAFVKRGDASACRTARKPPPAPNQILLADISTPSFETVSQGDFRWPDQQGRQRATPALTIKTQNDLGTKLLTTKVPVDQPQAIKFGDISNANYETTTQAMSRPPGAGWGRVCAAAGLTGQQDTSSHEVVAWRQRKHPLPRVPPKPTSMRDEPIPPGMYFDPVAGRNRTAVKSPSPPASSNPPLQDTAASLIAQQFVARR